MAKNEIKYLTAIKQEKPKKKTRDPLDGVSGTEDW